MRRSTEGTAQVVLRVKPVEAETQQEEEKPVKKRGRPPKKSEKPTEVEVEIKAEEPKAEKAAVQIPPKPTTAPRPSSTRGQMQNKQQNKRNNHQKNSYQNRQNSKNEEPLVEVNYDDPNAPRLTVNDLTMMTLPSLREKGKEYGLSQETMIDLKRQDLTVEILKAHTVKGGIIMAYGSLEILPDGYGFLRSPQNNYLSGPEDIYISISHIKMMSLKTGDTVEGMIRAPRDAERYFAMVKVVSINNDAPEVARTRAAFDSLIPLYPDSRLNLETTDGDISTRIINLFCPIGKGQRGLIVAPPRAGKTILMQKIANAISENHPEVYLMVLLIDEDPKKLRHEKDC